MEVLLKGKLVKVVKDGVVVEKYEVIYRFKPEKPKPRQRVVFENFDDDEQLRRTFFAQHMDAIDLRIQGWRARNPKHIDSTVLPTF